MESQENKKQLGVPGLISLKTQVNNAPHFANSVNEVLGWFGINLLASFQDITQNMFLILAKISHLADLQIYYFNLELVIELHWWHVKCLLSNMLLK